MADIIPSIRTFQVFPDVPASLQPLLEMAHNLWWVWNPEAVDLFRRLDRDLWETVYHNPVKLLGVGLLYRNGYFQQYLSADGWQQEAYPELDFYNLPIQPCTFTDGTPVQVRVDLPENSVFCKVWKAQVGRIPLYLLDTNLPENAPSDRDITSRLYGAGTELRIKQELVLGIGGTRAMEAMNVPVNVYHMNEGHSAF